MIFRRSPPMARLAVLAAVVAGAGLAVSAAAQVPAAPAVDPLAVPGPGQWRVLLTTETERYYYAPLQPSDGYARFWLRIELSKLEEGMLSMAGRHDLDCARRLDRKQRDVFYRRNGLVEPISEDATLTAWTKTSPDSAMGAAMDVLCADGKPVPVADIPLSAADVAPEPAPVAPVTIPNLEGWTPVADTKQGKLFFQPMPPVGGLGRLMFRKEVVDAEPGSSTEPRSSTQLNEFDCRRDRQRTREVASYARNGLIGPLDKSTTVSGWLTPQADGLFRVFQDMACLGDRPRTIEELAVLTDPGAASEGPAAADAAVWDGLEPLGWIEVARDEEAAVFMRPGPPSEFKRLWMRVELREPKDRPPAATFLYDNDCKTGRSRILQKTQYARNNLGGATQEDTTPEAWTYPTPGSIAETVFDLACRPAPADGGAKL